VDASVKCGSRQYFRHVVTSYSRWKEQVPKVVIFKKTKVYNS